MLLNLSDRWRISILALEVDQKLQEFHLTRRKRHFYSLKKVAACCLLATTESLPKTTETCKSFFEIFGRKFLTGGCRMGHLPRRIDAIFGFVAVGIFERSGRIFG